MKTTVKEVAYINISAAAAAAAKEDDKKDDG